MSLARWKHLHPRDQRPRLSERLSTLGRWSARHGMRDGPSGQPDTAGWTWPPQREGVMFIWLTLPRELVEAIHGPVPRARHVVRPFARQLFRTQMGHAWIPVLLLFVAVGGVLPTMGLVPAVPFVGGLGIIGAMVWYADGRNRRLLERGALALAVLEEDRLGATHLRFPISGGSGEIPVYRHWQNPMLRNRGADLNAGDQVAVLFGAGPGRRCLVIYDDGAAWVASYWKRADR